MSTIGSTTHFTGNPYAYGVPANQTTAPSRSVGVSTPGHPGNAPLAGLAAPSPSSATFARAGITPGSGQPPSALVSGISPFAFTGGTRSVAEETALLRRSPVIDLSNATAADNTFGDVFTHKAGIWSSRMAAGEVFDHTLDKLGKRPLDPILDNSSHVEKLASKPNLKQRIANTYPYGYDGLFGLRGAQDVSFSYLRSPKAYKELLHYNFKPHLEYLRPANMRTPLTLGESFFKFGVKDYFTKTLWGRNVDPIRPANLIKTDASGLGKISGAGVAQALGLGLFGWDIAKTTKTAYDNARHEDGATMASIVAETGKEFAKQATKSLITWEVAGAGLAVGRKILPGINIGTHHLPLGGMAFGALLATGVNQLLEKVAPKPKK
ncbi:MAG: hypothetical protein AB7P76_05935 [Candidatus Melainabacteria bacterium]